MATFLDVTGLSYFSSLFVFFFVLIALFAMLTYWKILGENKLIHLLLAAMVALFIMTSTTATAVIENIAPWFAVLFVFIILISMAGKMVSADMGDFAPLKNVFMVVAILFIVIGAGSTIRSSISVPGDNETGTDYDRDYTQTSTVFFHPKFLGMLLIFAIAVFTVALLVSSKI